MPNRTALTLLLPLSLASGCYYEDHKVDLGDEDADVYVVSDDSIRVGQIETGARLENLVAGEGVGLFVEYDELRDCDDCDLYGLWTVTLSCDTNISGYLCDWDLLVTPHWGSARFWEVDLETDDLLQWDAVDPYSVRLLAYTDYDLDGFELETEPGAPVRFDFLLDGDWADAQHYVYWVGDGALHAGAPSNPLDLLPE